MVEGKNPSSKHGAGGNLNGYIIFVRELAIIRKFVSFVLAGLAVGVIIMALLDTVYLKAIREALLQSWMIERSERHPPKPMDGIVFVSLKANTCAEVQNEDLAVQCADGDRVDRTDVRLLLSNIEEFEFGVLLMDVAFDRRTCDEDSLRIVRSIINLSEKNYVILPYSMSYAGSRSVLRQPLFNSCLSMLSEQEQVELRTSRRILMGQTVLYESPTFGGASGFHPWISAVVEVSETPEFLVRRVPSVASLAAMVMNARSDVSTVDDQLSRLEAAGYAVFWDRIEAEMSGKESMDPLCEFSRLNSSAECLDIEEDRNSRELLSPPVRVAFRLGWRSPDQFGTRLDERWSRVASVLDAGDFDISYSREISRKSQEQPTLIVVGASLQSFDAHTTPIGTLPGGWILANAYYDLRAGTSASFESRPLGVVIMAWEILKIGLASSILFIVLCSAFWGMLRWNPTWKSAQNFIITFTWPLAIIIISVLAVSRGWSSLSGEFDDRTFLIAILALIGSSFDCKSAVDEVIKTASAVSLGTKKGNAG